MSYASLSVKDLTSLVSRSGTGSSSSAKHPGQTRPVKVIPLQHPDTSNEARPPSIPFDDIFSGWTAKIKRMSIVDWIDTLFPCSRWIRTYRWNEYFKLDLMAGITVGMMLVPQVFCLADFVFRFSFFPFPIVSLKLKEAIGFKKGTCNYWLHSLTTFLLVLENRLNL